MIDPTPLHRSLDSIVEYLRQLNRRVPHLLQPGLSEEEILFKQASLPFSFTEEIIAIYRWRNGTIAITGDILDQLNFFPGFYFLSLDEAILTYRERERAPQWRYGWFPFFADGAGDFYVSPCSAHIVQRSAVVGFLHGEPRQVTEYESIEAMIQTLEAAYAEGAFFLDDDDTLEIDDDHYTAVANRFNPSIPEWQN